MYAFHTYLFDVLVVVAGMGELTIKICDLVNPRFRNSEIKSSDMRSDGLPPNTLGFESVILSELNLRNSRTISSILAGMPGHLSTS
jgi:hypothetical protein